VARRAAKKNIGVSAREIYKKEGNFRGGLAMTRGRNKKVVVITMFNQGVLRRARFAKIRKRRETQGRGEKKRGYVKLFGGKKTRSR